jgi:hypothetical protein
MQFIQLQVVVTDADEDLACERTVKITPDYHGLVVEIEGTEESIVIDLEDQTLTVWRSDENGDINGAAAIELPLADKVQIKEPADPSERSRAIDLDGPRHRRQNDSSR